MTGPLRCTFLTEHLSLLSHLTYLLTNCLTLSYWVFQSSMSSDMTLYSTNWVFLTFALFPIGWLAVRQASKRRKMGLPPGPTGWPLIGNLLDWPLSAQWVTFTQWAKQYGMTSLFNGPRFILLIKSYTGDIVHLNVAGTHMIIVNSVKTASGLLDTKGSVYSDRPSLYFTHNLVGYNEFLVMMDDGPTLRNHRRLLAQGLSSKVVIGRYTPMLERRSRELISRIVSSPSASAGLEANIRRSVIVAFDLRDLLMAPHL
jgi:hypothetical protein